VVHQYQNVISIGPYGLPQAAAAALVDGQDRRSSYIDLIAGRCAQVAATAWHDARNRCEMQVA
jgi:hypothetical protein